MVVDPLMIRLKKEKDTDTRADIGIDKGGDVEGGRRGE